MCLPGFNAIMGTLKHSWWVYKLENDLALPSEAEDV